MFRFLSNLLHKKRVRNDALLDRNSDDFRMQNAQFVSFLQKSGFRQRLLNRHEKTKHLKSSFRSSRLVLGSRPDMGSGRERSSSGTFLGYAHVAQVR